MDNWKYHLLSVFLAVLCLTGVMWVGTFAADRLFTPDNLQRLEVIRQLFSTDEVGLLEVLQKEGGWDIARKYAAALADAAINFEFLPYNEGNNLTVLMDATPDEVTIQSFQFIQRDLEIRCTCQSVEPLQQFRAKLQQAKVYSQVDFHCTRQADGTYQGIFLCHSTYGNSG